jgi:hypothetical protein
MSLWSQARKLADRTPPERNRYVDLLRAVSIAAVVFGHWLIAAPWIDGGKLKLDHLLALQPATQWLTLLFQVMPVFFLVGGYSNAASWEAALRRGTPYGEWAGGRVRRLVGPVLPLVAAWVVLALVFRAFGVHPEMVRQGSTLALVPIWFLAVYLLVVLLVPWTRRAWSRFGIASYWALVAGAVVVDVARFAGGHRPAVGWINYVLVWTAVHQLGYLWRDGRLAGPRRALPWAVGGVAAWLLLARFGPYPISMVGVPGEEISNTLPPDVMLLALGAAQAGLLLAIEAPMRRWLARSGPWTATVLVNASIMSVYLWHLTALALLVGAAKLGGGVGLHLVPGTGAWWAARPVWLAVLACGLGLVLVAVARFERLPEPAPGAGPPAWRVITGATLLVAALTLLALGGIGRERGLGVRVEVVALAFAGALVAGIVPSRRTAGRGAPHVEA